MYLYNLPAEPFLLELLAQCELDRVVHPRRPPGHAPLRPTLRYLYTGKIFVNVQYTHSWYPSILGGPPKTKGGYPHF